MLYALLIFLITAIISFAGSIQLGAVNLSVIQTTLNRGFRAGILVSIGGSLPEMFYAILALEGNQFLQKHQNFIQILEILIIPIFFGIGLFNIFQKTKPIEELPKQNHSADFLKGLTLSMLNPQLLPFWLLILVSLNSYFMLNDLLTKSAFVVGTAAGAFVILYFFARLSLRYKSQILKILQHYPLNKIIGYIFIVLALWQLFRITIYD